MAKGYSLDALVREHYMKSNTALDTANLDTYTGMDNVGVFYQRKNDNATEANGYPLGAQAGTLEVVPTNANSAGRVTQRYTNWQNLRMWVRGQNDGRLDNLTFSRWVELINANNIYNAIYPIGIVLQFDNATNPNNVFTGTVWEQITDGRAARAATGPVAGTTDGQIGSIAGEDTAKIAVTNLPGHTHGMQNHTHGISEHSHKMTHNHSINHDHPAALSSSNGWHTHSLSGDTTANGDHSHSITVCENDGSGAAIADSDGGGIKRTTRTGGAGNHTHSISGTADGNGQHDHWVDLPEFIGTSGYSSSDWVGNTSLTTWGPDNNTTTSTGDGAALNVRNSSHYYAFWKRVA